MAENGDDINDIDGVEGNRDIVGGEGGAQSDKNDLSEKQNKCVSGVFPYPIVAFRTLSPHFSYPFPPPKTISVPFPTSTVKETLL